MQGLFDSLVKSEAPKLKYLLTNKLSQNHLQLFFCAVRSANGSNNNPTARQSASTYKRPLFVMRYKGKTETAQHKARHQSCLYPVPSHASKQETLIRNWNAETCYFSASMIFKNASHAKMNMITVTHLTSLNCHPLSMQQSSISQGMWYEWLSEEHHVLNAKLL